MPRLNRIPCELFQTSQSLIASADFLDRLVTFWTSGLGSKPLGAHSKVDYRPAHWPTPVGHSWLLPSHPWAIRKRQMPLGEDFDAGEGGEGELGVAVQAGIAIAGGSCAAVGAFFCGGPATVQ